MRAHFFFCFLSVCLSRTCRFLHAYTFFLFFYLSVRATRDAGGGIKVLTVYKRGQRVIIGIHERDGLGEREWSKVYTGTQAYQHQHTNTNTLYTCTCIHVYQHQHAIVDRITCIPVYVRCALSHLYARLDHRYTGTCIRAMRSITPVCLCACNMSCIPVMRSTIASRLSQIASCEMRLYYMRECICERLDAIILH